MDEMKRPPDLSERSKPTVAGIFADFLRLGLTAFGGPAMVGYIRDLAVRKRGWVTEETFQEGVALCQSLPGATAMQTAAYAGLRAGGAWGAVAAYTGFGLPAFFLMVALSAMYHEARNLGPALAVFRGLQAIVVALVANATWTFGRTSLKHWKDLLLAAATALFLWAGGSPILAVGGAAFGGLILHQSDEALDGTSGSAHRSRHGVRPAVLAALAALLGAGALFFADRRLFGLAAVMVKVDLFAFGGGFASLPLLLHEVVEVRHWLDARTFLDGIALGQVTPGPIVITATFVGYQIAGLPGAIAATLGIFTPSLVVLLAAVPYLDKLRHSPPFRRAIRGVLASFVGLLGSVALRFGLAVPWGIATGLLALLAFLALRLRIDILWVILVGTAVSLALF
jgi:chromate transporter